MRTSLCWCNLAPLDALLLSLYFSLCGRHYEAENKAIEGWVEKPNYLYSSRESTPLTHAIKGMNLHKMFSSWQKR